MHFLHKNALAGVWWYKRRAAPCFVCMHMMSLLGVPPPNKTMGPTDLESLGSKDSSESPTYSKFHLYICILD